MSEAIYAMPDMTKKVKFDRSEAEERIVDIYVSADTLRDHETSTKTEDVEHTSTNGPGDQHTGRQQTRYNLSKERDQLQREKDDLMEKFSNLSRKRFESCWYFVSTEKKTWSESRKDCLERGADLVIINSKKEMRFLYGLKKRVWIGLTDRETEGSWKWVDGTPLKTGFWGSKQPSSGGGHSTHQEKDCVELDDGQHQPEKTWNDSNCDNKLEWICELCNKNLL
ncbi:C-type lectin domain family 4 member E isoform X2 [Salmo salar]|uniref:C-type lectin domain family 4 member E isoform X2 n=1 Tax=Salmo salar TaxID=8030 RepID=A0ABM3ENS8_SALSA|nr:C-type lectin domain family 4 member E-like isoform X2 [Salmo salar]